MISRWEVKHFRVELRADPAAKRPPTNGGVLVLLEGETIDSEIAQFRGCNTPARHTVHLDLCNCPAAIGLQTSFPTYY